MSRFKKAVKKKELESALAKHPLRELDEQVKEDYIKGLIFIATEDKNFDEDEKSYITSLMKNIRVDEAKLGEFETFVSDCEEAELLAFMDRLKAFDEDIKINFMIEVVVIAFKDGEFDEAEQEMFSDYLEMLELTDKKDDIMYLATSLVNKDIDLALAFYTAKKEMFEKYDYMFDMLNIDIEKEMKSVFSYEWTVWELETGYMPNGAKVSINPETVQKYSIVLNSLIMSGDLVRRSGTNSFTNKDDVNTVTLQDTDVVNLVLKDNLFSYSCDKSDSILLKDFIFDYDKWISIHINDKFCSMELEENISRNFMTNEEIRGLVFQVDCANKPSAGMHEFFWNTGSKEISFYNGSHFDEQLPGTSIWLLGQHSNSISIENVNEFTFRLMKVEGE